MFELEQFLVDGGDLLRGGCETALQLAEGAEELGAEGVQGLG